MATTIATEKATCAMRMTRLRWSCLAVSAMVVAVIVPPVG
jgi:hypothetical protein